jgi:L-lactate dehydrogenase complex protein LldG
MKDGRARILAALRAGAPAEVPPLPSLSGADDEGWIRYPDRVDQFARVLPTVGGQAVVVRGGAGGLAAAVAAVPAMAGARRVCSLVDGVPGSVDLAAVDDARALADLDVTIARAALGVAENGALWFSGDGLRHRAALVIAQHVIFVVRAADLVDNMHDAYRRIGAFGPGYGVFISGPSKTADIEQSLVIGAHGPRSATVLIEAD